MERSRRRHLIPALLCVFAVVPALPQAARAAPPIEAYGRLA